MPFLKRCCFGSALGLILFGSLCNFNAFAQAPYSPVDFGQVTVAGTSSQVLTFSFTGLSQAPTFVLHYSVDFTAGAPTCTPNGSSCTVPVTFSPQYPGTRQDAIIAKNSAGVVIATQFLHGTGLGPLLTVSPGVTTTQPLSGANISYIAGFTLDMAGNYYLSDYSSNRVVQVNATSGIVTIVAGQGGYPGSYTGDGGPAINATLNGPSGLALDSAGNLYIVDSGNHVVRRVDGVTGIISTVAGNGQSGYSGDNGPAVAAQLNQPVSLAVDVAGNLFICDRSSHVIREVNAQTGIISTVAGTGASGYSGDNGLAVSANLNSPQSIVLDAGGNLYIADSGNYVVREVNPSTGIIVTIAGTGTSGYTGDGGSPLSATFSSLSALAVDPAGNLLIADSYNSALREVSADHTIVTTTLKLYGFSTTIVGVDSSGSIYTTVYSGISKTTLGAGALSNFTAPVGSSTSLPVYLSNSGTAALGISAITITGANASEFSQTSACGTTLAAGATCKISVTFYPRVVTQYSQPRTATLNVIHNGPFSPAAVALSGTSTAALSVNSSYAYFPSTVIGSSSSSVVTVQNVGSVAIAFNSIAFASQFPALGFTESNNCGSSLAPHAACQINLVFTPTTAASYSGNLNISYGSPATVQTVSLNGTGLSSSIGIQDSLYFGPQTVLTRSFTNSLYLYNSTPMSVPLSSPVITGPAAKDFSYVSNCGTSLTPNAGCSISVYFSPFLIGSRSATLTISDNTGPHNVSLSGTGSLPLQFEIINSATGKVLDIANGADGTIVRQSSLNGSPTQIWRVLFSPAGFEVVNVATQKALDVMGGSSANGTPIQQYTYFGYGNQQWQFVPVDDVHYKIVSSGTGKVLDVPSASRADGTPIQQWDFNGNRQQLWTVVPATSYTITNGFSSKALNIAGNSMANGASIQQSTFVGVGAQQWQFVPVEAGYYAIMNLSTGKILDVTGASSSNGGSIQQYDYLGYGNQQWQLLPVDNAGNYEIVSRSTGKVLDDTAYSTADGTPVQQWDYLGGANQQWQISPVNYSTITGFASGKLLDGSNTSPIQIRTGNNSSQQKWQVVKLPNNFVLIANGLSGQFLQVAGASMANGALIEQAPYTGSDNQQWALVELYDGYNAIVNKATGKALDVAGYSTNDGALLQQYQFLGGTNQQWYISNISNY